ncbi:unnamed protein product [Hydatigera taeniaeformis]|uniref:DB domain-containing protein n=1 Tax=Hydatigena taeniaeformis TaxID=6205 RepID=A0A0R3WJI5_HYDTA|nr:unnamed protein product [Hydatigera taeniaeformis]
MDYMSSNAFCILLILILQRHAIASRSEQSLTEQSVQHKGVWINKGLMYSLCVSLQFDRRHCANFSLVQRPVAKNRLLRPDCAFLMNRLKCSLYKLNCPSHPDFSFQVSSYSNTGGLSMYDIPCQSSCHVTVDICGTQAVSSQDFTGHWQAYPKRSSSLYLSSTPSSTVHLRPTLGVAPPTWQQRSTPPSGQSVWPWRPYVPSIPHRRAPRASYQTVGNSGSGDRVEDENEGGTWYLRHEDCRLLPSGGCDDWARKLVKHHRYYTRDYASETRQNSGCPRNFEATCEKMFPQNFNKNDWKQGNFTVALIMRISQTFWWFGKSDRFQSFFRFNVKRTLKSDIVEYNDKIILTNAWPSTCACPNKLVVGKKYLLLTHSRISRQSLRISTESVFLEKPKKYMRLILPSDHSSIGDAGWDRAHARVPGMEDMVKVVGIGVGKTEGTNERTAILQKLSFGRAFGMGYFSVLALPLFSDAIYTCMCMYPYIHTSIHVSIMNYDQQGAQVIEFLLLLIVGSSSSS